MSRKYTELFVFYRRNHPVHVHSDRTVFEQWMAQQAWLYPPAECEIARFIPEPWLVGAIRRLRRAFTSAHRGESDG